jgi:hypothetical protein
MLQAEKKIFASRMSNIQIVSRIYAFKSIVWNTTVKLKYWQQNWTDT